MNIYLIRRIVLNPCTAFPRAIIPTPIGEIRYKLESNGRNSVTLNLQSTRGLKILDMMKEKVKNRRKEQIHENFKKQISEMIKADRYTLVHFRKQIDEGMNSWSSKVPFIRNRPEIATMRDGKKILDSLTAEEQHNPRLINDDVIKRVAVASEKSIEAVRNFIQSYEQAETIQRWLKARKAKGQKIPEDSIELQELLTDPSGITIHKFLKVRPHMVKPGMKIRKERKPLIF